ncbi:MAG: DUF4124 domain-containing protein [gamma proteobacterium symbiont of Lucinoma myriamae]|nr:DUF4124 domain-containing protein [gamma proteobacterium symbiont of Lucinoma myriamae]MCU7819408.1 DUF4124 domain-containing protein [gamma proteobacterium symbiont of Lucinoma myriamae]MCU7831958.1 DUF4124 domain-containing protein [gamma proteobacterium symbiont of Lucinoma myriamae]
MKSITNLIVNLSLITLFSCILSGVVLAEKTTEIYKWVDKDGRVHYAARPGDSSAKKMHLGSKTFRKTNKESQEVDAEKKQNEERAKLCQDSKDTLAKDKKAPFLNRYDEKRKLKVRLTESETQEAFLQAEKEISYWCNPPQKAEEEPEAIEQ